MISTVMNEEVPFTTAFIITTYSHSLEPPQYYQKSQCSEYVSDLLITDNPNFPSDQMVQSYKLGQSLFFCVIRNKQEVYVSKISNISQHNQGWQQISKYESGKDTESISIYLKKNQKKAGIKLITSVYILEQPEANKIMQSKLQSQFEHEDIEINKITLKNQQFYIYTQRKQVPGEEDTQQINLRLVPESKALFEQVPNQIDISVFPNFCQPKGVELFKKQSGFKTFNFTMLNNLTQRVYCTSLQFREPCPKEMIEALNTKYKLSINRPIYAQKTITMISKYSCTDQITHCLQHLYRVYLSKGNYYFEQQVKQLAKNFTLDQKKKKAHYTSQQFQVSFKVNSSYPQTSINAIYAVFKFLKIEQIVQIFEAMILENKIFFISDCKNIVGYMVEAFQSFIYPLIWVHNIIPQLNHQLIDYTSAPMPLIVGLSNQLSQDINKNIEGLYVYVDSNKIYSTIRKQKRLKDYFRKLLIKRLSEFSAYDRQDIQEYLSNTENMGIFKTQKQQYPNFDAYRIRNIFFELLVFLLKDYRLYFLVEPSKQESSRNRTFSIKKLYNFTALKTKHEKDPFLVEYFSTGLFEQLIETKINEPKHKWLRILDKAIKKINEYQEQYIKEQSDFYETEEEAEKQQIPRGCLNLIHLFSRQSEQRQKNSNSESPRKSYSPRISRKSLETTKPTNNTNQTDLQHKNSLSTNPKNSLSDDGVPQLDQNNMEKVVYYIDDVDDPEQQQNSQFCFYLSYPYRKVKQSTAAKWTKTQFRKLRNWRKKQTQKKKQLIQQQNKDPSKIGEKVEEVADTKGALQNAEEQNRIPHQMSLQKEEKFMKETRYLEPRQQ